MTTKDQVKHLAKGTESQPYGSLVRGFKIVYLTKCGLKLASTDLIDDTNAIKQCLACKLVAAKEIFSE